MTPPALLALGAGSLVCALTASASLVGWPGKLARRRGPPPAPELPEATAAALLALVPPGCQVRLEAVEDAAAIAFARTALTLLEAAGRRIEAPQVAIIRGIGGNGYLHLARNGRHVILALRNPESGPADAAWARAGSQRGVNASE
jgi:hypothetical protein